MVALRAKLVKIWLEVKQWSVLSLGKGYYEVTFAFAEDMRGVRALGTLNLNPGSLKLFSWTRDFNLSMQNNTFSQVRIQVFSGVLEAYDTLFHRK